MLRPEELYIREGGVILRNGEKVMLEVVKPADIREFIEEICEHLLARLPMLEVLRRSDNGDEAVKAVRFMANIKYVVLKMRAGEIVPNIKGLNEKHQCYTAKEVAGLIFNT